jgi:stage V sporulation protein R
MFINEFIDQDFMDKHKLFVSGKRLNAQKGVWEYYVKSRDANEYKRMLIDSLYHPPHIEVQNGQGHEGCLYLNHIFEGKPLLKEFIENTMLGIEYLWGEPVKLETTEWGEDKQETKPQWSYNALYGTKPPSTEKSETQKQRVVYTMKDKKLTREVL